MEDIVKNCHLKWMVFEFLPHGIFIGMNFRL